MAAKNKELALKIIHEAIGLLGAKKIAAHKNYYIDTTLLVGALRNDLDANDVFETAVSKHDCQVCALGSLFMAKFSIGQRIDDMYADAGLALRHNLRDAFSEDTLYLMEIAFEESVPASMRCAPNFDTWREEHEPEVQRAKNYTYGRNLDDLSDHDILLNILGNMLQNEGEFIP